MRKIENKNVRELKKNPNNPRTIKDESFKKLVKSIREFPEMLSIRPIVIDADNTILGGNMRYAACVEAGLKEVPTITVHDLTDEQKREFVIKDNVSGGDWDWDALTKDWDTEQLEEWGLSMPDTFIEELEAEDDAYEEPETMQTDIVLGDLFEIGEHRLLCGDSTDSDAVSKLMNSSRAQLAFTSPPYNAGKSQSLSGSSHLIDNKYNEYNDNQTQSKYLELLNGFTNNAILYSDYLICNIQMLSGNKRAFVDYLSHYKDNIIDIAIWDKGHGAPQMQSNVMTNCWEFLIFISSKHDASRSIPNASFKGNVDNIYRGTPQRKNEYSRHHAATFPIDLPEWAIKFTPNNSIILDQFLGTGTTMVAAHQLDRKCYGIELDPKYCQIIIDRMLKLDPTLQVKRNGKPYQLQA